MTIPPAIGDRAVWLHVGTLLDGTGTAPVRDAHVVYTAREILFVGASGATPPRALVPAHGGRPDVIALDATLLPGLIDAHAHLFLEGGELDLDRRATYLEQAPDRLLDLARARLARLARLGIAGVRDAGDRHGVGLALSRLGRSGRLGLAPYIDSPGAAINRRGRYGGFMAEPLEAFASPAEAVAARVAAGADRIKLIPTGIINFRRGQVTAPPQMTAEDVRALTTAARTFDRQTFAHASGDEGIDCALEGGVDSIEHGFFVRDDQLSSMRDRRIAWVPTFAPVRAQVDHHARMGWDAATAARLEAILERHAASLVRAHARGVIVIAGSDAGSAGVAHGLGLLRELALMERAGLDALSIVNSATGTSAGRLRYREPIGRVAAGFRSRFILTRHSPLETVMNLGRARTIVFDADVFAIADDEPGLPGL
jgi:imidazolonepropionase-like amidohydrolase